MQINFGDHVGVEKEYDNTDASTNAAHPIDIFGVTRRIK
jgi:hypothetical protein